MAKQRKGEMRWARPDERMPKDMPWKSKPGNKVLVANRGEVRFDFPEAWVVSFGDDSIRINDREPPDDECILQLSVHYLPIGIDLSGLPVRTMVENLIADKADNDEDRKTLSVGDVISVKRPGLDIAWFEQRILDVKENREAISRLALSRAKHIQALITFDFWPEDFKRLDPVWTEVLRTLRVGEQEPSKEVPVSPLPNHDSLLSPFTAVNPKFLTDDKRSSALLPPKKNPASPGPAISDRLPRPSPAKSDKPTFQLPENHGFRSDPGYLIFIANRGEVRFDYPETWTIGDREPITMRDRPEPNDTTQLVLNIYHPTKQQKVVPPITEALLDVIDVAQHESGTDPGYNLGLGEPVVVTRDDVEMAWRQAKVFIPQRGRELYVRSCVARAAGTVALLTYTFPVTEVEHVDPIWQTILRSIQIGNYIEDPRKYFLH